MNMCIEFRAMKPERSLPPPPDMMIKPVSRLPELFDQKRPALLSFSQAFTLELGIISNASNCSYIDKNSK